KNASSSELKPSYLVMEKSFRILDHLFLIDYSSRKNGLTMCSLYYRINRKPLMKFVEKYSRNNIKHNLTYHEPERLYNLIVLNTTVMSIKRLLMKPSCTMLRSEK